MTTHVCVVPSSLVPPTTTAEGDAFVPSRPQKFLRLPHPRTGVPSLYLVRDASSLLEVQAISPDASRSWFTETDTIIGDGKLLILTPIDPVFLVLAILQAATLADKSAATKFRPLEDIFEDAATHFCPVPEVDEGEDEPPINPDAITNDDLNQLASLPCTRKAMERICDFKEITEDITVFRYSPTKLLEVLRAKVARLSEPAVFDSFQALTRSMAKDGLGVEAESKPELRQSGRVRAACLMLSQYLPQSTLDELLASYDFAALDAHLKSVREEDLNANAPITQGNKENGAKDKKADTAKKGKGKNTSTRGVQQLAKANVQGMAKLSTFFQKKPAK